MSTEKSTLATFIGTSAWGSKLQAEELFRVLQTVRLLKVGPGHHVTRIGEVAEHWFGIVDGVIVQTVTGADGKSANLTAASFGTWFGEGTLMKHGSWGYDAISQRDATLALVPASTFHWLMETSLPFTQFVARLLNRRLSHYMGLLANERLTNAEQRLAHMLASLFDPELYPNRPPSLRMNQTDIALLAGLSRQRANAILQELHDKQFIEVSRSGVKVLCVDALRAY